MEKRIIIAGSGGQGILFFGKLIAYAAMLEGKEITWFPSYGAEIRGGTATCTVVISDDIIGSPVIKQADILIAMNEASYDKYIDRIAEGGMLIFDSSHVRRSASARDDIKLFPVPASEIAAESGYAASANMALTGSFSALSGLATPDCIFQALEKITPARRKNLTESNKTIIMKGHSFAAHP
jgi:2-oxoglutarate ferredoxin oxidoreductase subunit gamma